MGVIVHDKVSLDCGVTQSDVLMTIRGGYNVAKVDKTTWRITCTVYMYCNQECYEAGLGTIQSSYKIWDVNVLPDNIYTFIYAQVSEPWRKSGTIEDI